LHGFSTGKKAFWTDSYGKTRLCTNSAQEEKPSGLILVRRQLMHGFSIKRKAFWTDFYRKTSFELIQDRKKAFWTDSYGWEDNCFH